MRRLLSLAGLLTGLGVGAAQVQTAGAEPAPNPSVQAFQAICLAARAKPGATAKAALAAHWSPIDAIAIPAMGGAAFQDAAGYRAPGDLGTTTGVWVIIGRTPMPGFSYLADSCAVFAAPADTSLPQAVLLWAGGPPTVDESTQQLIQYAFAEPSDTTGGDKSGGSPAARTLVTDSIDAAAPGLQAGTISLVTVIPGVKRSVLIYSVVNP